MRGLYKRHQVVVTTVGTVVGVIAFFGAIIGYSSLTGMTDDPTWESVRARAERKLDGRCGKLESAKDRDDGIGSRAKLRQDTLRCDGVPVVTLLDVGINRQVDAQKFLREHAAQPVLADESLGDWTTIVVA